VNSYAEYLRPFLPYIPSDLISAQCFERVLSVTQPLPAALGIGPFMFECNLDGRPAADFSVAVMASRDDHAALSRLGSTDIATPPLDNPGWTRIRQFARSWADGSSLLSHTVEEVWLEFDVCLTQHAPGNTPSVFFSLRYESPQEPALRRKLSREYFRVAKEGLDILQGRPSRATLSTLAECFDILPAAAQILFLGAFISRDTGTTRVVVSGLSFKDMVQYLRRLGVRPSSEHLALVADITRLTDYLWLEIDIEESGVTPRVGFDCYCKGTPQSANNSKWADLLDFFVDTDICTDDKRSALLDAADMSNHEFELTWPESLRRISKIFGPAGFNRLELQIHHIKVIDRPGAPLEAKAYLCGSYK
jgi:hypothetical protein